jgi:hypothetical protein
VTFSVDLSHAGTYSAEELRRAIDRGKYLLLAAPGDALNDPQPGANAIALAILGDC